jgi:hypothetical protein
MIVFNMSITTVQGLNNVSQKVWEELLYSGKITRGENFRYIRGLNASANLRNREYLYIKLKNVFVIV